MDRDRDHALTWGGVGCVAARTVWLVVLYGHSHLPTQGRRAPTPFGTAAATATGRRTTESLSVIQGAARASWAITHNSRPTTANALAARSSCSRAWAAD